MFVTFVTHLLHQSLFLNEPGMERERKKKRERQLFKERESKRGINFFSSSKEELKYRRKDNGISQIYS